MHYLATMWGRVDADATPGTSEFEAEVERYAAFDKEAGQAVVGGEALYPVATSVNLRHPEGRTLLTDGPYPEQAEVIGGFYVFEADNLDEAVELGRRLPAAEDGAVEIRPMWQWNAPEGQQRADCWIGLLWEQPDNVIAPDTKEWAEALGEHQRFAAKVGAAIRGGGAVHPPSTATTVRVREGKLLLTDGPFPESAEVVDGLYLFAAPDEAAALEIATDIPCSPSGRTEVRRVVDFTAC